MNYGGPYTEIAHLRAEVLRLQREIEVYEFDLECITAFKHSDYYNVFKWFEYYTYWREYRRAWHRYDLEIEDNPRRPVYMSFRQFVVWSTRLPDEIRLTRH